MSTAVAPPPPRPAGGPRRTAADVAAALGVPPDRLLVNPAPGTATEADAMRCERPTELIEGTLVAKPVNYFSSKVALQIVLLLGDHLRKNPVAELGGVDGSVRMSAGNLRLPDVSVTRLERLPDDGTLATLPVAPDLAIEVLSPGNTKREMANKRAEYFASGAREVWEIDLLSRTGRVYRDGACVRDLTADDAFDGGEILPGFTTRLADPIDAAARSAGRA